MGTASMAQLTGLLNSLGRRARAHVEKPDLRPAVWLVNDLGRLAIQGNESEVRAAAAAVAAFREQLDMGDTVTKPPSKALSAVNSHVYLAGAMWAINEVMNARISSVDVPTAGSRSQTRKHRVMLDVLRALSTATTSTPSSLLAAISADGAEVRPDEVSRALGDLLQQGLAELVAPQPGADRRTKRFAITPAGRSMAEQSGEQMSLQARQR